MTAEQFAYWMQGFAELNGDTPPTKAQWKSMKEHLQTVFVKVTPPLNLYPIPPAGSPPWMPPAHGIAQQVRSPQPLRAECLAGANTI